MHLYAIGLALGEVGCWAVHPGGPRVPCVALAFGPGLTIEAALLSES
ncbi:MAG TPA: hypothetical protein VMV10_06385 [Pirellulales bacterium]|nr:hypothetical protein [Pirellulales bacterium]